MYISTASTSRTKLIGGNQSTNGTLNSWQVSGINSQQTNHFDLNEAYRLHSWVRATCAAFGRTVVGPGMVISRDSAYTDAADDEERKFLWNFYTGVDGRDFSNISDFYPWTAKLYRTAGQFRLFGQATWEIRRNGFGEAVSFDVVPGFVWPNIDENGSFRDPPFTQFISPSKKIDLELNPDDVAFFMNPDFGSRAFATDFESISEYVLPTDIHLIKAMRSMLQNYRTPFGVYSLHESATQEETQNFSAQLDSLYRGAENYGKSAVVVHGETSFKASSPPVKDLPFEKGHALMKDEIEGVSGVSGSKLGRTDEVNRSNMREIRRDYWETTQQPIVSMLADQMYLLIHRRIFGIDAWRPEFLAPDFLTQVEKATVAMRGRQWGGMNTNEFRKFVFSFPEIKEDWANEDYLWPTNMVIAGSEGALAGEEPVSEPGTDSDAPIRGDTDNTEEARGLAIAEMRAYSKFCLNRHGKQGTRKFNFEHVSNDIVKLVDGALETANNRDDVKQIFSIVLGGMNEQ